MVRAHGRRGFSLVEILVAIVFMSIAASAMLSAITGGAFQGGTAKYRAIALGVAQDEIEKAWMQARSGSLTAGSTSPAIATSLPVTFTVNRTIAAVTTDGIQGLYRVTVTVVWTNPRGATETVSLQTMIRDWDE